MRETVPSFAALVRLNFGPICRLSLLVPGYLCASCACRPPVLVAWQFGQVCQYLSPRVSLRSGSAYCYGTVALCKTRTLQYLERGF